MRTSESIWIENKRANYIEEMMITELLNSLKGVKKTGAGWTALCPAHEDHTSSLSVGVGNDGKVLMHCHANKGCNFEAICAALGISTNDLFPTDRNAPKSEKRERIATYDYHTADGELAYQVVRYQPKTFRQRRPDGNGGWIWNMAGVEPLPYQLPELLSAIENQQTIFTIEGEKDVKRARQEGLAATTNHGGAGKWTAAHSKYFPAGTEVIIIPDQDIPGHKHAEDVASQLYKRNCQVKVVPLSELGLVLEKHGKDLSDWLDMGFTIKDLLARVEAAPYWQPSDKTDPVSDKTSAETSTLKVKCLADVQREELEWIWYPFIPKRKQTLLVGDPGAGKSWITSALASCVAAGWGLPGMAESEPKNVLLLSAEDGLGDTLKPRLEAIKADVSKIFAIDDPVTFDPVGLLKVEAVIAEYQPAIVIIDTLTAYIGSGVDMHRANETRPIMAGLARIAQAHNCAIVSICHLRKGRGGNAIYQVLGSIDLIAAVRSVLLAGCDPDNPNDRAIVQIKNNLAPYGAPIGYEIREGAFYWKPETTLTEEKILGAGSRSSEVPDKRNALQEAKEFLTDALANGPQLSTKLFIEAKAVGIADRTLRRAKAAIGIEDFKPTGKNQPWFWRDPSATRDEDGQLCREDGQRNNSGHLELNSQTKEFKTNSLPEDGHPTLFGHLGSKFGNLQGQTTSQGQSIDLQQLPQTDHSNTANVDGREVIEL